ncbi:hypothetical protein [Oceanicella sp. SM1341]|uniref:hypothetical protein n=1 Tax=Oceanicella sp. SM1341 TaxID=1548889 RepID=UPI000E537A6B|nr:hypothetical protein [Oceanicella sp. SM1341]
MSEEHAPRPEEDRREFAEETESLWRVTFAPALWALHFLACYGLVSLACARGLFPIGATRAGLVGLTLLVLAGIAWLGWRGFRQWDVHSTGRRANPGGHAEDRHQFLGHAAFLLAIISFIGVIFVSLPLIMLEGCR